MVKPTKQNAPRKMFLVVCGDSKIHKCGAHAAVFFDLEAAMAEKTQMEKCEYPCKGVFEIETINIFNKIPHYLES